MSRLIEGARVWPVIPVAVGGGHGYVGVGRVTAEAVRVRDFKVEVAGTAVPILTAPLAATDMGERADDPELSEYVARVDWIDTRPQKEAFWETGMFHGRQVVGEIRDPFTLQRLRGTFGADGGL